jgi:hypothetical protein
VSGFGGEIGIAGTTKHAQVLIRGGDTVEGDVWTSRADHLGREVVQHICDSVDPFYPVASQNRSLKEQVAHHIINGVENTLVFTVLQRSVWTRCSQNHPISDKKCVRGSIVELTIIIALDGFDDVAKLCGDISEKIDKVEKVSDLTRKRKVHIKWER